MYEMITPEMDIAKYAAEAGVRFVRKDRSRLHRFIGKLSKLAGYDYMQRAWTTIGRTIAVPVSAPDFDLKYHKSGGLVFKGPASMAEVMAYLEAHRQAAGHEFHHIEQHKRLWWFHEALYFIGAPLPTILAWYRTKCEVEPYAWECAHFKRDQRATADTIWKIYFWPWPKGWLVEWLANRVFALRLKL